LRVYAQCLGAGARVGNEERADYSGDRDGQHGGAAILGTGPVEDGDPAEHRTIRHAIERGVVECPENGGAAGATGDRTVQHVEQRREAEDPAGGPHVARGVYHATRHRTEGADGGDGVRVDPAPHHVVGYRLDHLQVAALYRLPESFHAPGRAGRPRARGPSTSGEYDKRAEPMTLDSARNTTEAASRWQRPRGSGHAPLLAARQHHRITGERTGAVYGARAQRHRVTRRYATDRDELRCVRGNLPHERLGGALHHVDVYRLAECVGDADGQRLLCRRRSVTHFHLARRAARGSRGKGEQQSVCECPHENSSISRDDGTVRLARHGARTRDEQWGYKRRARLRERKSGATIENNWLAGD